MPYIAKATTRTDTGKSLIRKLRRAGNVPAVMYGHGDPSVMLTLSEHGFGLMLEQLKGHSPVIDLDLDGEATRCVIKTLQRNPINGRLLHVDFQKVHASEKITIDVPVILQGTAIGVKEGGLLDFLLREVSVRATIDRIPEHFDVDISNLSMGQSVHISDLPGEGIEFILPPEATIISVLVPRKIVDTPKAEAVAAPVEGEAAAGTTAPVAEAKPEEPKDKKKKK